MMRSLRQLLLFTGLVESDAGNGDRSTPSPHKLRLRPRVLLRVGFMFTLVALLTYFFPIARTDFEHGAFSEGTIAPYEVIAPENFKVLKNETEYKGRMKNIDSYMNLIMTDAEEQQNGKRLGNYGRVIVRGNNVLFIKLEDEI